MASVRFDVRGWYTLHVTESNEWFKMGKIISKKTKFATWNWSETTQATEPQTGSIAYIDHFIFQMSLKQLILSLLFLFLHSFKWRWMFPFWELKLAYRTVDFISFQILVKKKKTKKSQTVAVLGNGKREKIEDDNNNNKPIQKSNDALKLMRRWSIYHQ